jgi:hypothetical protein
MCEIGLVRFDLSLPESQCEPFHLSSCEVAPLRCECVVVMLLNHGITRNQVELSSGLLPSVGVLT